MLRAINRAEINIPKKLEINFPQRMLLSTDIY